MDCPGYYLITNIAGTAHPRVGSIDRINDYLTSALEIESYCWWRDDLDRRLDAHSSVKWSYPEVLKATDLLEALISGMLGEDEERRRAAIRAYMTAQYEDDEELKFKQVELRSTMTSLFVDLPMTVTRETNDRLTPNEFRSRIMRRHARYYLDGYYYVGSRHEKSAEFFLNAASESALSRVVLEGAPGQGKSTITQYVCQVMRMQLLGKETAIQALPKEHRGSRVRIPFRVDLRDLAKWLVGTDPFQSKAVKVSDDEPKSLEGFLAAQVRFVSGGHQFNVTDLAAVARASHIFLALDGFDEVADVEVRRQLVAEISRGTTRLMNAGGFSIQTVVTSRPAAFAKSVRFPKEQWTYFELLPLERREVDDYTSKWMRAKGLKEAEKTAFRRILDSKLREPHTQFLAKNPMQLTILLALIYTRGPSLPEKRTSMYDTYMDLFFSRESEKSDIVRDHRDLLIDIHRYLAWKLQTAAEAGGNGSIEYGELRTLLLVYLDSQGENTAIVGDLFDGVIERVGALVSRVQETYEFEVQPLREYFAARHLYETAPYSPTGAEKSGTKLDRFDGLARNPYWLNVARFYGGCFSKGEISALVDELNEVSSSEPYKLTSHPRTLALMLLGDWVFTQYQPAVKKVVALIGQYPQLRQLLANAEGADTFAWSGLPERCGKADFIEILHNRLRQASRDDERRAVAKALIVNQTMKERMDLWKGIRNDVSRLVWINIGNDLECFVSIDEATLAELFVPLSDDVIHALLRNQRFDLLYSDEDLRKSARRLLLFEIPLPVARWGRRSELKGLEALANVISYYQYGIAINDETSLSLKQVMESRFHYGDRQRSIGRVVPASETDGEFSELQRQALRAHEEFLDIAPATLNSSLQPWVTFVEALRAAWGDCPAFDRIAIVGAGIRSKDEPGAPRDEKATVGLVEAIRFMRLKSGAPRWWEDRLGSEKSHIERNRLLLVLWTWATPKTMIKLSETLANILNGLDSKIWEHLCREHSAISTALMRGREDPPRLNEPDLQNVKKQCVRFRLFVGSRLSGDDRFEIAKTMTGLTSSGTTQS
jgi:hypothetical protein